MSILFFILFGLIVGLLARAIMPGEAIVGLDRHCATWHCRSFVGGFIGNLVYHRPFLEPHSSGFIGSILGALVVLAIVMGGRRRALT